MVQRIARSLGARKLLALLGLAKARSSKRKEKRASLDSPGLNLRSEPSRLNLGPMAARKYGLYINGQYIHTRSWRPVTKSTHPSELLGEVSIFDSAHDDLEIYEAALEGLTQTFDQVRHHDFFPLVERLAFLGRLKARLEDQRENLAQLMMHEVGKPLALCRSEVDRAIDTLHWTLEEAASFFNERPLPLAGREGWKSFQGFTIKEGRGPLLAIGPFNFPLNLLMHKIAPAIAAGCPVLLKPSSKSVLTALCLVDYCHAEGLPPGMINLFSCVDKDSVKLIEDPRIKQISFTGSSSVGWKLKSLTTKPFTLELGGAAPAFVGAAADLEKAALALAKSSISFAGQSCISTQSIHVEASAFERFTEIFKKEFSKLDWGMPSEESVICGPVIDEAAYKRLESLKTRLISNGARVIETSRDPINAEAIEARLVRPAYILNLTPQDSFLREECFGPLVSIFPIPGLGAFVQFANALPQRLQASVWGAAGNSELLKAARSLDYGGVVINEASSQRFDAMPYGGRGEAGAGREGPRYALEEFTDWKSILVRE